MMKKNETTMKNDEKGRKKQWKIMKKIKNNEKWWMMKNRETTMNHDEKLKKKTMKNDEK